MGRSMLIVTICCAAVACASRYQWVKPGMTPATRDADIEACAGRTSHLSKDDVEAVAIVDRCMASRGYEQRPVD